MNQRAFESELTCKLSKVLKIALFYMKYRYQGTRLTLYFGEYLGRQLWWILLRFWEYRYFSEQIFSKKPNERFCNVLLSRQK